MRTTVHLLDCTGNYFDTVTDVCWVATERCFHGVGLHGDKYLFWDVLTEGTVKAGNYRRIA